MKRLRRSLAAILVIAMVMTTLGMTVVSAANTFTDVSGHWAQEYIQKWSNKSVINGYEDGTFRPDANISRAEAAKVIVTAKNATGLSDKTFTDVEANEWYSLYISRAVEAGYVTGDAEGTFRPNDPITREEAAAIMARAYGLSGTAEVVFSDNREISDWASASVQALVAAGAINGYEDGSFRPQAYISRAELVKILDVADTAANSGGNNSSVVRPNGSGGRNPVVTNPSYYNVKCIANGGTIEGKTEKTYRVKSGATLSGYAADPVREGYEFMGWYRTRDAADALDESREYSVMNRVTASVTLYAGWKSTEEFVVSFDYGNGTVDKETVLNGETVSKPSGTPERAGWKYTNKWYTDAACTKEYTFSGKVTKDMTLYAGWELEDETAADSVAKVAAEVNETAEVIPYPQEALAGEKVYVTVNVKKGNELKTAEVTYVDKSGAPKKIELAIGENGKGSFEVPEDVDASQEMRVVVTTEVSEPEATATPEPTATAVPKYEVESAPVSHGRVEVSPSGQQQSGQEVTIAAVADTGYEVKGISVTKKDNAQISVPVQDNKFIMPEYAVTVNVTIAPTVYAIHYDLAQGSVENANPENYTIESDEIVLNNPTRGGYSFAGWTGTALDSPTMRVVIAQGSTGERSYTATWTRILTPLTGVSISGAALVGQRLAAVLTPDGAEAAYQWYRGDQPIDNAVEASYTVTNDDIGSTIKVTATGSGNYTGAVTSDATAAVPKLAGQVSVTTADTSKAYDGNAFAVEGTSSTGQTVKVSYAVKDGETLETAPVNAGTYVATIKAEENAVYTEAVAVHEFTILQKELTITWPDVLEFMQDGSEKRVTPEITGFVGEDSAANIITVANDKATAVGDYTAAVTLQNADGNYKLPANSSQDWKITAKPTYVVTLTQGTGYTLAAKDGAGTTVEQGGNFSFTLALDAAYNKSVPVVKVNDVPLEAVQGVYTIADIGEAKTVTVDGVTLNSYTVTFKVDGNVYGEVQTVSHGANAETPVPPTKDATASTVYTFNSWDKALTNITADVEINAVFDETVRKYTVKFVSEGQELQSTEVEYGTLPVYAGATPQKSATAEYTFTFDKWTPDVAEVTGEATYTAVFTQQAREYNIQYYVDNELKYTDTFAYGAAVTARNPESREGYTFSGWSTIPEIMPAENVRVDGSFAVNSYDVTVSAENGSVNFTEGVAENKANYGTTVKFTVTPNENYVVQEVKYNGTLLTAEAGVYSFTMPAENVAITCVFAEDPDYILVRNAVAAISEMQFAASSEEAANAETALAKVKALLGTIENVSLQVNAGSFNAAVDGTHSAPAGTAGSYTFTVTAQAGQKSMTSETLNMVISPKVYADSENAEINGITVSGVPAVGAETSYTVMLPYGTEVTAEDIAVSLVDAKASVTGKTAEGNVWTIIVTAESGAEKRYTLTVNYSANPDIAIVEGVVNAVNALAFEAVTNPTSQTAIEEMITGKLNGVKGETNVSVTEGVYTAAVDGTVENHAGTSGSYIFKVAVTKGEVSRTSNQLTVTIQPVAYTAIPLAVPENLRWTESSASWDAVANAAGYQVQLYKDGSPAGAAVSVTGSEVYDFAEMITETGSYTFTVKAVSANQEDYTDSAVSAQSAAYDFVQTYTVTVNKTGEGTVSITPEGKVEAGRQMTVTATPAAGQRLVAIEVSGGTVVSMDGNVGTFTMPAEDVTVSVLFAEIENIFINFSVDGQEYGNINGKPGTRITAEQIPADPVKDGFVFLGWYLEDTKYIFDVIPETDIQLEAKFAEINNDAVRTIVEAKAEDLLNPESKAAILSALEVVAANGSESDKAAVANISADVAKAIAEAVGATTEFVYTETSADEIQIPTIANMTGKGSDSYRVEIEKLNLFEHENLADKNTAVYDVSVFINEVKTSASLLPQIVNLVVDNNIDLRTVKAFSVDDAGVWEDLPILGMQGNIITVKTSHFSKIGVYSDPVEDPDTQGTTAEIQLEKVDDGLYNIVLTPTGTPNQITRFASAEFTLNNTVTTGDVGMEVNAGADLKMSENGTSDNNGTVSTKYLIYVDVDGGKAPITKAEGERLIVGNVRLTGVGEGTLNITEAQGYTKSKTDALVKNLTLTPGADAPYTLTEATNPFKLTISFNNKVELTNAAYTDMKVRVSGSNGKVEEIALGDGEPGVTSEIEGRTSRYIVDLNLVAGVRYSVTISGAGYRNYTKSFTMPENEGVNMHVWNNVMDMPASVITGESDGDTTVTFLAGDIVKDGKINIYDLSAVVSYFGEVELDNEETSALAKYDLNRDGKIDSKDVAMVLVSWNN